MAALLILIIFTSGYTFIQQYPLARYKQSRLSGQEAYSHIGIYGVLFALSAWLIVLFAGRTLSAHGYYLLPPGKNSGTIFSQHWTEKNVSLGIWVTLSHLLPFILGRAISFIPNTGIKLVALAYSDSFNSLLLESTADFRPIQVTLSSRKTYVGIAMSQIMRDDFTKDEYFEVLPLLSGYRDKDTLELKIISDYEKFYQSLAETGKEGKDEEKGVELDTFKVVVPVSEVKSAAFFRPKAHQAISLSEEDKEEKIPHVPFRKRMHKK
ncbi:hypothetical protein [Pseudogulbenkiania subflava]|uniref:Heat-inducible transcription repressor HrcA n=1 Tax=Pseudogulbenkiania subflava DSM 22618 TaxID=1123014 RepID=A0A1Y6BCD4_9NEIS|nr:hypothetical protein [Pseudogulbenkiania subflava]SMF03998.1 heat-inducible transcription repressor HrcA [Pseudogulbenkiania subflava DSM 22618]